jgi:hypothetical protein
MELIPNSTRLEFGYKSNTANFEASECGFGGSKDTWVKNIDAVEIIGLNFSTVEVSDQVPENMTSK